MSRTRLRTPLEVLFGAAVAATIVAMTLHSGSVQRLIAPAGSVRFPLLALAAATAAAYAVVVRPPVRTSGRFAFPLVGLCALALASLAWSVDSGESLARAFGFTVLALTALLAAAIAATTRSFARALMAGIAAGSAVVAFGGLIVLAVEPGMAMYVAGGPQLQRFRGLGANANTSAALAAVASGAAVWLCTEQRRLLRTGGAATVLLLTATVVFSGSRSSALALFVALGFAAFGLSGRKQLRLGLGALAAGLTLGVALGADEWLAGRVTEPAAQYVSPASALLVLSVPNQPPKYPGNPGRLESELGTDAVGFSSGRLTAWRGALEDAAERPVAGYGFGMERRAFVDRYADFQGAYTESSLVGSALELGLAGVLALIGALGGAATAAVRALTLRDAEARNLGVASGAMVAAGVVLAFALSYVLTPGNLATFPFWLGAGLCAAVAGPALRGPPRPRFVATAALALVVITAVGAWQGGRHTSRGRQELQALDRETGGLGSPRLASFRLTTLYTCFGYDFGRTAWDVEECYDLAGRLVEGIDRRGGDPSFASLRFDPAATPVQVAPETVRLALDRAGGIIFSRLYFGGFPPPGLTDSTPIVIEKWLPIARWLDRGAAPGTA